MSDTPKIHEFYSLKKLVDRLRDDFVSGDQDFVMLYAYNGTGKTRISMKFKDVGKEKNNGDPDTLYYNAFTEDLFCGTTIWKKTNSECLNSMQSRRSSTDWASLKSKIESVTY